MQNAVQRGVNFLEQEQPTDGSFLSYSAPNTNSFAQAKAYRTVFTPALILDCLNSIDDSRSTGGVKKRIADFLLAQKSNHWSFNYWTRDSGEAKAMPYPDDLDDTFCALAALVRYEKSLVDSAALAKIVTLLTAAERKEGGPYRTWLVPDSAGETWKDVDLAVNNNIAYFLSLLDIDLPNLTEYVESAVESSNFTSRYYPSPYPVVYFISRWYQGKKAANLRQWIETHRHPSGHWGTPLTTALATSALLRLGGERADVATASDYLEEQQQPDGSWPPEGFCLDPTMQGKQYHAGSAALTTAFCLEALALQAQTAKKSVASPARVDAASSPLYDSIINGVQARFSALPIELRAQAKNALERIRTVDKSRHIALLPQLFCAALGSQGKAISDSLIISLGQANLYGWIAYTIYDDILDGEDARAQLSAANVCLRELTTIFQTSLPDKPSFHALAQDTLDTIDAANTWEILHCRSVQNPPEYSDLSRLADRSLGHALGPLAIVFSLGYKPESTEIQTVTNLFCHYLIARQLNDDMHDWEEDLRRGQVNAVGAQLLRAMPEGGPEKWRAFFWETEVVDMCERVIEHIEKSRKLAKALALIEDLGPLETFLAPVAQAAKRTLEERQKTLAFLESYEHVQSPAR